MCDVQVVQQDHADRLFKELPKALAALLPTVPKLEQAPVAVALNACSSNNFINRFSTDLRIYMEACLYSASCPAGPASFLITEDYKFFRTFARSKHVERVLQETTTAVLGIAEGVTVKLAGEVIPSL